VKEKKTLEDKVSELTSLLGDEEERTKQLNKTKNKYEAIIADLEQRLAKEQEVQTHDYIDLLIIMEIIFHWHSIVE